MADSLMQILSQLDQEVTRASAERRAARERATQDVMAGLQQRQQQAEVAEIDRLATSMTGREGRDFASRDVKI